MRCVPGPWCFRFFPIFSRLEGLQQCILRGGGPIVAFEETNEAIDLGGAVRNTVGAIHSRHASHQSQGSQALHIQPCLWDWSQHFGQFLEFKSTNSKNIHLCTAIPHTSSVGFCPNALNRMPTCHWSHATHNLCPKKTAEQRSNAPVVGSSDLRLEVGQFSQASMG